MNFLIFSVSQCLRGEFKSFGMKDASYFNFKPRAKSQEPKAKSQKLMAKS
jgi:hypothetical protein